VKVVQNKDGYNFAVDIWSLGCTVLEMATGKPPWSQFEGVRFSQWFLYRHGQSREISIMYIM
jgi:serine/threonine protein kinase